MKRVDDFIYLGSVIRRSQDIDVIVTRRIKADRAVESFVTETVPTKLKDKFYTREGSPTLLGGSEWLEIRVRNRGWRWQKYMFQYNGGGLSEPSTLRTA